MDNIEIGDIVTPPTPIMKAKLGTGIVVDIEKGYDPVIVVVFPSPIESFIVHNFRKRGLEPGKDGEFGRGDVILAGLNYTKMKKELQNC